MAGARRASLPRNESADLKIDPEQLDAIIGAELHSRNDAVLQSRGRGALLASARAFQPGSLSLIARASGWGELRDAVEGQIPQILESPPAEIRAALRHSGEPIWKQVLETAETAMSQRFRPRLAGYPAICHPGLRGIGVQERRQGATI